MNWLLSTIIKHSDLQSKMPYLLEQYKELEPKEAKKRVVLMNKADPTNELATYTQWIIKQDINKTAIFPEDTEKFLTVLKKFDFFKQKGNFKFNKDINSYATFSDLFNAIEEYEKQTQQEHQKKTVEEVGTLPNGAEVVLTSGPFVVIKISTPKASAVLCEDSSWCVRHENTAKSYLNKGPLYLFRENGKNYVLMTEDGSSIMLRDDSTIKDEDAAKIAPLIDELPLKLDFGGLLNTTNYQKMTATGADKLMPYLRKHKIPEIKEQIEQLKKNPPENTFTDPVAIINYAKNVLNGNRWIPGEDVILNTGYAMDYIKNIIKGRWQEFEQLLLKNPIHDRAINYISDIIKSRWPEYENVILKYRIHSQIIKYVQYVINGRWPEYEKILLEEKNPVNDQRYLQTLKLTDVQETGITQQDFSTIEQVVNYLKNLTNLEFRPLIDWNDPNATKILYDYLENGTKNRWINLGTFENLHSSSLTKVLENLGFKTNNIYSHQHGVLGNTVLIKKDIKQRVSP